MENYTEDTGHIAEIKKSMCKTENCIGRISFGVIDEYMCVFILHEQIVDY